MRNSLYIIGLSFTIISCASSKPVQKVATNPKPATTAPSTAPKTIPVKPPVTIDGHNEFYKINISDPTKNDNTISYGSIVSADPASYKVSKTYFPSVAQNFRVRYLILHYTAINNERSISALTKNSVSSHYLVNDMDDKEIYQLVDENKRAYHAGISSWRGITNLNDTSIGIEIVNESTDIPGGYRFLPFPEYQIKKVAALVKDITTRYQISPVNILGHADIAPTRKQDPGPTFPWKKLYTDYQIGMWYDDATKQLFMNQMTEADFNTQLSTPSFTYKIQTMLKDFGYGIDPDGSWNDAAKKTVAAFQYHFRPEKYDGVMDAETWAILQALLQKYPVK